jgi:hypothetical protein
VDVIFDELQDVAQLAHRDDLPDVAAAVVTEDYVFDTVPQMEQL